MELQGASKEQLIPIGESRPSAAAAPSPSAPVEDVSPAGSKDQLPPPSKDLVAAPSAAVDSPPQSKEMISAPSARNSNASSKGDIGEKAGSKMGSLADVKEVELEEPSLMSTSKETTFGSDRQLLAPPSVNAGSYEKGGGKRSWAARASTRISTTLPEFSWKKLFKFMGPAFLVSIAYMDPGNLDSDIQSGAMFEYQLVWVIFFASGLGLLLQTLAMRLGIVTRRNLAQLCQEEFENEKYKKYALFVIAELTIIASDVPEVVGTAIALKLLFGLPLFAGVILTAVSVFIFLGLERFGARFLEFFIAGLIAIILFSFLAQVGLTHTPFVSILGGLAPQITSLDAMYSFIALLGSVVMPHNLFLHSGLVQSREFGKSVKELKDACRYNTIESAFAIGISVLVNVAVISVAAKSFFPNDDTGLRSAPALLAEALGDAKTASVLFGVALLASGQSSTMTGTFAGQIVMEGFIDLKMSNFWRSLITRGLAIFPSLVVSIVYGDQGADDLIVFSQVFLSFLLPFPLICLIKFTNDEDLMGKYLMNTKLVRNASIVLGGIVTIANIIGLVSLFIDPVSAMDPVPQGFSIFFIFLMFLVYLGFLFHLIRRPWNCKRYANKDTPTSGRASVLPEKAGEYPPEMGLAARYSYYTLAQLG
jgi:NRAMP (natural resistance-associated macrophage protein)-like metal ion transporter